MKIVKYDATKISPTVPASSQYSIGAAVGGSSSNDDNQDDYKPMFARFILDPIWHIYNLAMHQQDVKAAAIYARTEVRLFIRCLIACLILSCFNLC